MNLRWIKRISAMGLAVALAVGLFCSQVQAATTVTKVSPMTGSDGAIEVTVYDQTPGEAGTGAEISGGLSDPVQNVGINALRIGTVVELTTTQDDSGSVETGTQVAFGLSSEIMQLLGLQEHDAIASQDGSYYFVPTAVSDAVADEAKQAALEQYLNSAAGKRNAVTGADGLASFRNLEYGVYLLAKSALPAEATTDLVPFLVSVPAYVETDGAGAWQPVVYAYPKVRTGHITLQKTAGGSGGDGFLNAGETVPFTVTVTIPATGAGNGTTTPFTSFVLTDTNPESTLQIDTSDSSLQVLLDGAALDVETPVYENGVLTMTLSSAGLAQLNANLGVEQTVTLHYNATIATGGAFSSKLTNTAALAYDRGNGSVTVTGDAVHLYTYGVELTKTLSDGAEITPDTIGFALYRDAACQDQISVSRAAQGYWRSSSGSSETMYAAADGKLYLYGLEPGTYYLKELTTMDGYTPLDAPVEIQITANPGQPGEDPTVQAAVNGADAQVSNGVVSLSVENTRNHNGFSLPRTGGAGTLAVTAIGLGLLCVGVVLLLASRKKRKD